MEATSVTLTGGKLYRFLIGTVWDKPTCKYRRTYETGVKVNILCSSAIEQIISREIGFVFCDTVRVTILVRPRDSEMVTRSFLYDFFLERGKAKPSSLFGPKYGGRCFRVQFEPIQSLL
jgi:hypothetical protein